jgi:putative tryptophan/tyrosine transport system substrate-binding protein
VGSGFVRSLAHPGGNITGFISFEPAMGGKWLETLSEIAPRIKRVALIYNPQTHTGQYFASIETAARSLAIEPVRAEFREAVDIERTVGDFARQPNGRLLALSDPNVTLHRASILGLATRLGLPAIYPFRYFVAEDGLAGRRVTTLPQRFRRNRAITRSIEEH